MYLQAAESSIRNRKKNQKKLGTHKCARGEAVSRSSVVVMTDGINKFPFLNNCLKWYYNIIIMIIISTYKYMIL